MTHSDDGLHPRDSGYTLIDLLIRLLLVGLLVLWTLVIVSPFAVVLIWASVLTVAVYPLHGWLSRRLAGSEKLSALLITASLLSIVLGPVAVLALSAAGSVAGLIDGLHDGTLSVPMPPEAVETIPLIGPRIDAIWRDAATNIVGLVGEHREAAMHVVGRAISSFASAGVTVLLIIVAVIISGCLLKPGPAIAGFLRKIGHRIAGPRGVEFVGMAAVTIRNVSRGVLGISVAQAVLLGIGFLTAGIPGAGILSFIILILCILQIGPGIVVLGVLIWAWSNLASAAALLLTIYAIPVTLGDNVIKPVVMSKGLTTPTLVIFAGVIGGSFAHGLIGLFLGPIVLAVFYDLVMSWLDAEKAQRSTGPE